MSDVIDWLKLQKYPKIVNPDTQILDCETKMSIASSDLKNKLDTF